MVQDNRDLAMVQDNRDLAMALAMAMAQDSKDMVQARGMDMDMEQAMVDMAPVMVAWEAMAWTDAVRKSMLRVHQILTWMVTMSWQRGLSGGRFLHTALALVSM